jgi:hypothetical protein
MHISRPNRVFNKKIGVLKIQNRRMLILVQKVMKNSLEEVICIIDCLITSKLLKNMIKTIYTHSWLQRRVCLVTYAAHTLKTIQAFLLDII